MKELKMQMIMTLMLLIVIFVGWIFATVLKLFLSSLSIPALIITICIMLFIFMNQKQKGGKVMLAAIAIFILATLVIILDNKQEKYLKKLRQSNLELRIENEDLVFEMSKIKNKLKEIEKIANMNNYNNKEFQLRKVKEILAKIKY